MEQNKATLLALDSLSIYRGLLEDQVLSKLKALLHCLNSGGPAAVQLSKVVNGYNEFFFALAKSGMTSLTQYILDLLIFDENPFSFACQRGEETGCQSILDKAVSQDLANLQRVAGLNVSVFKAEIAELFSSEIDKLVIIALPEWTAGYQPLCCPEHIQDIKAHFYRAEDWVQCLDELKTFYQNYGCGVFARYYAFVWEKTTGQGYLKGIDKPDPISLEQLVDYQYERNRVIENTLQFLNGFPANNVLLYGDRGTGKSSTVKGILNRYHSQGLRMIEIPKAYLADFPLIIRQLKNRSQKFIIFVDDLVFGDNEENYTSLKAVLEGGLESKTPNILIYATSNRRHLVKEYFSERAGLQSGNHDEEVHARDSMQEKLSLADRFGINVVFSSPDQNQYLAIVKGIAEARNLNADWELLRKEALQWALWYNGRSARTAKQFVDWFEGHVSLGNQ
ncbi:putative ATPase (AAA+ superfamily) [Desulfosporosinus orientis DSM 765]|uniref:Putative ATPase (AAA+ superfamily) n=1 Tax=Desulfosporosinus orientis (strain ATCC 19365 / DSM 765 / NCIMB 8382 / VKM B-1628 / Singapore I) TaxID=768706 RepID=G7WDZ4_DESOD|nr:ATP-binding protein [Desulfosporosinus orientis]AET69392.1 putative ATPase (AAA+ superfamily) [Desulfosporosinus orientis DSM 765]